MTGLSAHPEIVSNLMNFSRADKGTAVELYDINTGFESTLVVAWNKIKYVADVRKDLNDVPQIHARGGKSIRLFEHSG